MQTLNDQEMNCRNSSHYCVAALQRKEAENSVQGGNLRTKLAKVIKLRYEVTYVWNRPNDYISMPSKTKTQKCRISCTEFDLHCSF